MLLISVLVEVILVIATQDATKMRRNLHDQHATHIDVREQIRMHAS